MSIALLDTSYILDENKITRLQLARRDAILEAVGFAASGFLQSADWRSNTNTLLGRLGHATWVHRIYIFENGKGPDGELAASQRFEWVAPGVPPQIDNPELQDLPFELGGFGRWASVLSGGNPIVGLVEELPQSEREILEPQGIRSILVTPIFSGDRWWGFMGFDECAEARVWSLGEIEALRVAAGAVGAAVNRQLTEEALRTSEEQLRQAQKMEAIGKLAGGVAHDFNNLLTIIQGYTELLLATQHHDSPALPQLQAVQSASVRAAALTRQLLAFSRRQVLLPDVVSINAVVQDMMPMLARLIGEDISIETKFSDDAGTLLADKGQLDQVILNLVVNARDAMPKGGTITIATERVNSHVCERHTLVDPKTLVQLSVSDTGIGMDRETLKRIFEPFFTTKEQGRGTGLGLSTVYGIVKQSDGTICCSSTPGQGTTFRLLFPFAAEIDRSTEAAPELIHTRHESVATILLVEDDADVRMLAQQILSSRGYTVIAAESGREAIEHAEHYDGLIDLLISDMVLPGMSGYDVVQAIRTIRPEIKVLYASGYPDDDILRRGLLKDAAFLGKPFTPPQLLTEVDRILVSETSR